MKRIFKKKFN